MTEELLEDEEEEAELPEPPLLGVLVDGRGGGIIDISLCSKFNSQLSETNITSAEPKFSNGKIDLSNTCFVSFEIFPPIQA